MMPLRPFVIPGLTAILALVLAAECLLPGAPANPPDTRLAIPAAAPDKAADEIVGQWGNTILARPLFNPGRRPITAASTNTDTSLPRLSAIIIIGGTRVAIFAADGQKPQVIAAGNSIDGYRLQRVTPDSVDLLGPLGPLTLRPQFITAVPSASSRDNSNISEENPN